MRPEPGTLLSRLLAVCAMLCVAVILHAGFAAVQTQILNTQHMVSGDLQLADGGWAKACDGALDDCDGHLAPVHEGDDGPIHHHHGNGEPPLSVAAAGMPLGFAAYATMLELRPGESLRLYGRDVHTPDQPPRV